MTLCRSNLIGCLQSSLPLRHLIKDYFFCTGSDIMCKQWVLQRVCVGVCVWACVRKDWRQGPFSHVETWMKILCEYSKKPVTACLIIFGCSRPCHCLVLPSSACLSGGQRCAAIWGCVYPGLVSINLTTDSWNYLWDVFKIHTDLWLW